MKIRTDFVTNSSSSSYNVVVTIELKKGDLLHLRLNSYDGGQGLEGGVGPEVYGSPEMYTTARALAENPINKLNCICSCIYDFGIPWFRSKKNDDDDYLYDSDVPLIEYYELAVQYLHEHYEGLTAKEIAEKIEGDEVDDEEEYWCPGEEDIMNILNNITFIKTLRKLKQSDIKKISIHKEKWTHNCEGDFWEHDQSYNTVTGEFQYDKDDVPPEDEG